MTRKVKDGQAFTGGTTDTTLEADGADELRVIVNASATVTVEAYDKGNGRWIQFYSTSGQEHTVDPTTERVRVTVGSGDGVIRTYKNSDRR